ncbi:MAG: preprotein translocase subunit SecE [Macromonas sp.]
MATSEIETVGTGANKAKLAAAGALVLGGFVGFYMLAAQGPWVQWAVLLVAVAAAVALFALSDTGLRLQAYGRDSWKEVQKVAWPSRREATQMTGYVFAFVLLMALFLWLTDKTLEWLLYGVLLGWR